VLSHSGLHLFLSLPSHDSKIDLNSEDSKGLLARYKRLAKNRKPTGMVKDQQTTTTL
jgi:hypothetical protein